MTYETERKTSGRRPLTIVEIDVDTCENQYGVSPCTASLPSGQECFNTFATCQDKSNFVRGVKTLRFCEDVAGLPIQLGAIPSIPLDGVTLDPTIIDPAKTLGIRAKTTITFKDHPYTDTVTDPYVITRDYEPYERGTFWGKFIARNPNYESRPLRVIVGYLDDDNVFQAGATRLFLIDKITGPDSKGKVKLIAKDILKIAEDKQAKLPKASPGKITTAIDAIQTTFSVTSGTGSDYPVNGTLIIDKEIMTFTRTGDAFTVVRATSGTEGVSHNLNATVQECLAYVDENVIDIAYDILTKSGVDPSFIPFAQWEQERDDWLTFNEYSRVISKPTGVSQLLNELSEQSLISIWWDERVQQVKLKSMSPPLDISTVTSLNNSSNFIKNSFSIDRLTQQRITQLWLYSELKDQSDDNKRQENYQQIDKTIDANAESNNSYGDRRERIILGTWLTDITDAVKQDISFKTINKFRTSPVKAKFSCDAKDAQLWTGDFVFVTTEQIQDATGQPETLLLFITKAKESKTGTQIDYEATTSFDYSFKVGRWTVDDAPSYADATEEERNTQGFWSDINGNIPGATDATTWL